MRQSPGFDLLYHKWLSVQWKCGAFLGPEFNIAVLDRNSSHLCDISKHEEGTEVHMANSSL